MVLWSRICEFSPKLFKVSNNLFFELDLAKVIKSQQQPIIIHQSTIRFPWNSRRCPRISATFCWGENSWWGRYNLTPDIIPLSSPFPMAIRLNKEGNQWWMKLIIKPWRLHSEIFRCSLLDNEPPKKSRGCNKYKGWFQRLAKIWNCGMPLFTQIRDIVLDMSISKTQRSPGKKKTRLAPTRWWLCSLYTQKKSCFWVTLDESNHSFRRAGFEVSVKLPRKKKDEPRIVFGECLSYVNSWNPEKSCWKLDQEAGSQLL